MRLDDAPGLRVTVEVHGRTLPEYNDEDEDIQNGIQRTKYIEATTGVEFGVNTHKDRTYLYPKDDLEVQVHLDGKFACSRVLYNGYVGSSLVAGIKSSSCGQWSLERFTFADLRPSKRHSQR